MKCHLCNENKLSEEFPFYAPSENCDHALLHCLKVSTLQNALKRYITNTSSNLKQLYVVPLDQGERALQCVLLSEL